MGSNVDFFEQTSTLAEQVVRLFSDDLREHRIETGFREWDAQTDGLRRGELTIIGGRPSMGKTSLALSIVEKIAIEEERPCLYFTLSDSAEYLMKKLIRIVAGVMGRGQNKYSEKEMKQLVKAAQKIARAHLAIDDESVYDYMTLIEKCRAYKKQGYGFDLIVIDFLQLMVPEHKEDRPGKLGGAIYALKNLARELDCPILVLSQLSRAPEMRKNHRPCVKDLRDLKMEFEMAQQVVLLYRDSYYDKDIKFTDGMDKMELIVASNHWGPLGTVEVAFCPAIGKCYNPGSAVDIEPFMEEENVF